MFCNTCSKRFPGILRTFILLTLAISFAAGVPALATAAQASPSSLRDLPQEMQGAVSGALGLDDRSYHVEQAGENCRGLNAAQQFEANWSEDGLAIQAGKVTWGLRLEAWGYGDELVSAGRAVPQANEHRVEYHRSGLTEWYLNGPLGIEQGFTVLSPPKGTSSGGALTMRLATSGEARVQVEEQSAAVVSNFAGEPVLRFSGLSARDASGRGLRTWLEQRGDAILLRVDDREATYPVVIDPFIQQQELTASDGASGDEFATSVSLSADGNTALIGAVNALVGNNSAQGAAYVFVRSGGTWSLLQKLTASDSAANDNFGISVSLSADGSTALIGAFYATVGGHTFQGAAYVFVLSGGTWSQQKLTASDGAANDNFGLRVSLSADGSTALIGANNAKVDGNANQGAAYVFVRSGGTWSQVEKLTASDGAANAYFGYSVSLSGDGSTALIGAYAAKVGSNANQGAAYVFVLSDGTWSPQQKLAALDGASGAEFGFSVSLSADGNTALIGAINASVGNNLSQGAAYVFVNSGGTWSELQKLTALDGAADDQFGSSVSLSADGSTALIGADAAKVGNNSAQGAAYVFVLSGGIWSQLQKLTASDGEVDAYFGISVSLSADGNTALIGANNAKVGSNANQGAAYVQQAQTGSLTVTISPPGAVIAGAMWSVDGEAWQASGSTVPDLSIGSHTVAFSGLQGWTTPPSQAVNISYGVPASTLGTYTPFFAAIFNASITSGKAPLKVHFTNCSAGSFTKWLWHFGDGQTSKVWNPNHTYRKAGTYTVTLTMTGAKGTCACTQPGYITVYAAPKAHFSAAPRSGDAPLQVNFTNESSGVVTGWLWNFGDGTTSTDANPAHTYNSPRTYTAKLTVYGPGGAGSKTMSITVKK